jgi:hypothetical protein
VAATLASKSLASLANDRSTIISLANHKFETLDDVMLHFGSQLKDQVNLDEMSGSRRLLGYSFPEDCNEEGQKTFRRAQWLEAVAEHNFAHTMSSRSLSEAKGNLGPGNSAGSSSSGTPKELVFILADSLFKRGKYGGKITEKKQEVNGKEVIWQPARTVEESILDDMAHFQVLPKDVTLVLKMLPGKGLEEMHEQLKKWIDEYAGGDPSKFHFKLLLMTGKNDSVQKGKNAAKEFVAKQVVSAHEASIAQGLALTIDQMPYVGLIGPGTDADWKMEDFRERADAHLLPVVTSCLWTYNGHPWFAKMGRVDNWHFDGS